MKFSEQRRLAWTNLTAPRQRPVTFAMVIAIVIPCATWVAVSGLMDGAERVSKYRIESRGLARRILLGDEYLKALSPSEVDLLEQKVRDEMGDQLEFVSPFKVLDWPVEGGVEIKGRTINLPAGAEAESHPLFHDLGLSLDRSQKVPAGLFLCPRLFEKPGFDKENPPEFISLDLRRAPDPNNTEVSPIQIESIPVRGVLKKDPKELVYFIIPEVEANKYIMNPPLKSVRMTPLSKEWLDNDTLEEAAQTYEKKPGAGSVIQDAYVDSQDRLNVQLKDQFWTMSDWENMAEKLRSQLPATAQEAPLPLSKIQDGRGGAIPPPPKYYPLVGMYFDTPDSLPVATELLSDDESLQGHVDSVVAELITQLRSFSQAKEVILDTVKSALILLCFLSVSIVQFFRCVMRKPEAGMVKAMGLSNWKLCFIFCWEGMGLWLTGTTLGLIGGYVWGYIRVVQLYSVKEEIELGFDPGWPEGVILYVATLVIVLVSVQLAALWLIYRQQPADLLEAT